MVEELQSETGWIVKKINNLALISLPIFLAQPALATVKDGVDAWTNGDYTTAVGEWKQPAEAGDADAQFNMGQAYKLGRGVEMDLNKALDWFGKAARQGHVKAEDNYGLVLFQLNRRPEAMPYIQRSVERGEPRAQYILGTALFNGQLVEKDWVRAYALMTRASDAGIPAATRSLAQMEGYIPADQQQQGKTMAAALAKKENAAREQQLAGFPVSTAPQKPVAQPVELPPSSASPSAEAEAGAASAGTTYPAPSEAQEPVQVTTRPEPRVTTPKPQPVATMPPPSRPSAPASGDWRIQLIAAGSQAEAEQYADRAEAKAPFLRELQYYLDFSAKPYVRLQAGPFATKSEADKMCVRVKSAGLDCFSRRK